MRVEFRTINGICAKAIAMYSRMVGKQAFELLSDEGEKARILAGIYQRIEHDFPSENDLSDLATRITYIKNRMLSKEEIARLNAECDYDLAKIYEAYRREMRARSLMDFDDQLVYAYTMFRSAPALLDAFWDRYSYIMVDEAQDTSKIQHAIIELLAGREHHLFMVGDEDQSIYGFRAAYPEALLSFEDRYPRARVLLMETNLPVGCRYCRGGGCLYPAEFTASRKTYASLAPGGRHDPYDRHSPQKRAVWISAQSGTEPDGKGCGGSKNDGGTLSR